jgi:rhamnosyltransferase
MSEPMAFSQDTVAIIVSFNPDIDTTGKALQSLSHQCATVIVDNGSSAETLIRLREVAAGFDNVELICLEDNLGIACAQNRAINHVIQTRDAARFSLLLDHDSIPGPGMVDCLEKTFVARQSQASVAAVGPVLYDPRDNKYLDFHKARFGIWGKIRPDSLRKEQPVVEVDNLNSSGTLLSNAVFRETGGFDSSLFIDHVETDWCFRAQSHGHRLFATIETQLTHHMGDDVCYYWFLKKRRMPYRSPGRHYYIIRNSLLLQKRNYVPLPWKLSNLLKLCFTFIYFGFISRDRAGQRKQMRYGFMDGLKGVSGVSGH